MSVASDPIPYDRFFREQAPTVGRFLRGLVAHDDVDECLQETFLAALRAYDRFDGESPRAWVLAIARRKAIDLHRAGARRPAPTDQVERLAVSPVAELPLSDPIWDRVAALPEKQRAALVLRFALQMRHREIGAVLDCSEAAARRSVHEGIGKLRMQATRGEVT